MQFFKLRKWFAVGHPSDLQFLGCLHGVPLTLGHHGQEILFAHHARTFDVLDRRLVHLLCKAPCDGCANDPSMQHARYSHICNIAFSAKDFPRHIVARQRQSHHSVLRRQLGFGHAFDIQWIANSFVPFHFGIEILTANQFCIRNFLRFVAFDRNDTVENTQIGDGHIQFFRCQIEQNAARLCRCIAKRFGTSLNTQSAGGSALIQRSG